MRYQFKCSHKLPFHTVRETVEKSWTVLIRKNSRKKAMNQVYLSKLIEDWCGLFRIFELGDKLTSCGVTTKRREAVWTLMSSSWCVIMREDDGEQKRNGPFFFNDLITSLGRAAAVRVKDGEHNLLFETHVKSGCQIIRIVNVVKRIKSKTILGGKGWRKIGRVSSVGFQ